jgi:hypothetical protein
MKLNNFFLSAPLESQMLTIQRVRTARELQKIRKVSNRRKVCDLKSQTLGIEPDFTGMLQKKRSKKLSPQERIQLLKQLIEED